MKKILLLVVVGGVIALIASRLITHRESEPDANPDRVANRFGTYRYVPAVDTADMQEVNMDSLLKVKGITIVGTHAFKKLVALVETKGKLSNVYYEYNFRDSHGNTIELNILHDSYRYKNYSLNIDVSGKLPGKKKRLFFYTIQPEKIEYLIGSDTASKVEGMYAYKELLKKI